MEKTLIIYDDNGRIFTQITGSYIKPAGLQHIEIEVPNGKFIECVDVSATPHQVILKNVPPSEIEILRVEMARNNADIFETMLMLTGGM